MLKRRVKRISKAKMNEFFKEFAEMAEKENIETENEEVNPNDPPYFGPQWGLALPKDFRMKLKRRIKRAWAKKKVTEHGHTVLP